MAAPPNAVQAPNAATASLEFQAQVLAHVQDSIIVTDLDGKIVFWNAGATALFGYLREEMLGKTPSLLYPDSANLHLPSDLARILAGEPYTGEWKARRKDGTEIWVDIQTIVMRDPQGLPLGFVGVSKDMTARREAEEALRASEQRYREATAATEQALGLAEREKRTAETLARLGLAFASELDRDKLVQRITDEATALTRAAFGAFFHNLVDDRGESYQLYTLSGASREAFSKFPMPRNTKIFAPTFEGRGTVRHDDVTRSSDYAQNPPYHGMPKGHLPVRSYLAVPVMSRSGQVLGGLFFGHPEPGQFRAEHERLVEALAAQAAVALDNAQLYLEAQRAVSVRDEFLQIAAHELRTPTTALKLNVQTLGKSLGGRGPPLTPERMQDKLHALDRNVNQLGALINELLDVARISAGSLSLTLDEVDLADVVTEVAGRFEAQAAKAGSALHVAVEGPLVGRWDALRVEQIVNNLLSNALKYGAGKPVWVSAMAEGDFARLTVRDEGIGIAGEDLPRIFGRFERAVSGRHYGGMGLGLYITRKLVEAQGGKVQVHSALGQGARFEVRLPR